MRCFWQKRRTPSGLLHRPQLWERDLSRGLLLTHTYGVRVRVDYVSQALQIYKDIRMHWSLHLHSRIMSVTRNFNILYIHKTLCTCSRTLQIWSGHFKFRNNISLPYKRLLVEDTRLEKHQHKKNRDQRFKLLL
jgi:hypothetical protein